MKFYVKRHIETVHEKIENFKCETCGKGFYLEGVLKNHTCKNYQTQM